MTVKELKALIDELVNKDMGDYEVADDDGNDIDEVAVVMNNSAKIVVIR